MNPWHRRRVLYYIKLLFSICACLRLFSGLYFINAFTYTPIYIVSIPGPWGTYKEILVLYENHNLALKITANYVVPYILFGGTFLSILYL